MKRILDLSHEDARAHFLKGSSYFNSDLPAYISFEPILEGVAKTLGGNLFEGYKCSSPADYPDVNYNFVANKDGRLAWRPYELMHPVIYVSLVNLITQPDNWRAIVERIAQFDGGLVECCGAPVVSVDQRSDVAAQINSWWQRVEQRSLAYSLEYSYLLQTDVTDCYGSIYTHSICWALHGLPDAKLDKGKNRLTGSKIDFHIQSSRYGQTNGISQGSVLMDFIAEIVLAYVDGLINNAMASENEIRILRYRDDYRIFANSEEKAEKALKIVSDHLRSVGMKLGVTKTIPHRNAVEGSIKPDKIAGIALQDLGNSNAKTIQKQLLRLHSFGMRFPNSGALKRLVSEFHAAISKQQEVPGDLGVQVAIATDIAFVSPGTFPAIAGVLSHLIALAPTSDRHQLWDKVRKKMARVPYNGYLEVWLQRVTQPRTVGIDFQSEEAICKIVNGESTPLWQNAWIASKDLIAALDVRKIIVGDVADSNAVITPDEVELFKRNAEAY